MKKAICKTCGFEEEYEPDLEFGLTFFQCDGSCPICHSDLVDETGKPTKEEFIIKLNQE